jgi:hypothetical protein
MSALRQGQRDTNLSRVQLCWVGVGADCLEPLEDVGLRVLVIHPV